MAARSDYEDYRTLNGHRQALAALVSQQLDIFRELDMPGWVDAAERLRHRVLSDTFKILVLGEFRRGKSTFINALLREEVLPASPVPTTAIINEVKWGEQPRALLHFRPASDGTAPPAQEIPVEKLSDYVVIKREAIRDDARLQKEIRDSPYEKVELFWPIEICRNGVEIIDSPGLNEHEVRQRVTMEYLSSVDAVVFVLMCGALGSISEITTIQNVLNPAGHIDIFLVCNRFDQIRPEDRELVRQEGIAKLAPHTIRGAARIFFVSALDALEGRLERDDERVENSQFAQVESALEDFLARERGRVKLIRPANELKTHIRELKRTLPQRVAMLRTDLATLEGRYTRGRERLVRLEADGQATVEWLGTAREHLCGEVKSRAAAFYASAATEVPAWALTHGGSGVDFLSTKSTKMQVEQGVQELVAHLSTRLQHEFAHWQNDLLGSYLKEQLSVLYAELDRRAGAFLTELDRIRTEIAEGKAARPPAIIPGDEASPAERILTGIGSPVIGSLMTGGVGAGVVTKDILRTVFPQIAAAIVGTVLLGWNPIGLVLIMLGAGLFQAVTSGDAIKTRLRSEVGKRFVKQLNAIGADEAAKIAEVVGRGVDDLARLAELGFLKQIRNVRDDVESVVVRKRDGQARVDAALREATATTDALLEIEYRLDELITQVAVI